MKNTNKQMVNTLAHRIANEDLSKKEKDFLFTDLVQALDGVVKEILKNYFLNDDLLNLKVDEDDYKSMLLWKGLTKSIENFDMSKGDFTARFRTFSKKELNNQKRLDITKKAKTFMTGADSLDTYMEEDGFDVADNTPNSGLEIDYTENGMSYMEYTIEDFIASDIEGEVIRILADVEGQKERNEAFTKFFGKYTATERKKVQRVKQRLQAHLLNTGVCI